ncbi:hypothetical protein Q1695_010602 [Nippostrongylus brasiliensis]|nr:hypothetical protein Q1695_010602 [Nippostrongylus brasiliensis]
MDLTALIRQPTAIAPPHFSLNAFLHHPLISALPFPLDPLFGIAPAEPQAAATPKKARLDSPCSPLSQSSTVSSTQDEAYYERRRRNNDAAKRSRDARRMKEEAIAERAAILERENGQLRGQVALLKSETARLQLLLFSRQQLDAVATKLDVKSNSIDAIPQNTSASILPRQAEIQP